jgi:hypothetical protein
MINQYTLSLANDKIWAIDHLIEFLVHNQGKDIVLHVNPEAHCLYSCGLYAILEKFQFNSVTIFTNNVLETHPTYQIKHRNINTFFNDSTKYNLSASGKWNEQKIFGAFYGRPTANRLGIASYLYSKYNSQSEILLASRVDLVDSRVTFELDKLFEYDINSMSRVANLIENFNFGGIDYTPMGNLFTYDTPLNSLYENILVDIISEPNIKGNTFFPTEKLVRPILLKKPFIAMASKNYLEYVRQMGFHTFNEFWDETYDGYEGSERYLKILSLISTLASKSKKELYDLYNFMQFQIDHNYNLIVNKLYTRKITLIN